MVPFSELPLVLAGPILRRTEPESVTVWVALQQACTVKLRIYRTSNEAIDSFVIEGTRSTIAIGEFLHVVAVTARSTEAVLNNDQIYAYDLEFTTSEQTYDFETALTSQGFPTVALSYFEHQKPTFVLPPDRIKDLKFVHGSCRKPHGHGIDALPILDHLLETTASLRDRPQQLFLTGDQIYGDDVADIFLSVATWLGDAVLGWQELLPIGQRDNIDYQVPSAFRPGQRADIATQHAGFTAGLKHKRSKVTNHLFSLGEYYATYLLVWSPVCWTMANVRIDQHQALHQFIHTLWKVRRAMANIATYMIFDDHEVSDDWNLNRAWCFRVFGRPLGRRVVQNAMLAYSLFQAWGNTPEQFETGQSGEKLLTAAQGWSNSKGTNRIAYEAIANYIGMPPEDSETGLPNLVRDEDVMILDRHPESLQWHYTIPSSCHRMVVLDTRTWRGYPIEERAEQFGVSRAVAPPMLLCPTALKHQLSLLQACTPEQLPILVTPTNLFGLKIIDQIHHWQLKQKKVFSTDVGDAWNIDTSALARFLMMLFEEHTSIVVLSGDIHYSSSIRLSYQSLSPFKPPAALVQLTSSAIKNEELVTRILHTRLKDWVLPERTRRWSGWNSPARMIEQPRHRFVKPPDWQCTLEWVRRRAVRRYSENLDRSWIVREHHRSWLKFWRWKWFQDGKEIIGVNNIALVSFESSTKDALTVFHSLFWFSRWKPLQIVQNRYDCNIDRDFR
ncbi:PhoD-like phosphatase [Pseudanabaenaceae cyanobacterium LEGE 13415]|nr:PhoD-like phosphatase [Pseudanabaenaceae cyanobacterium LEGE 13415]